MTPQDVDLAALQAEQAMLAAKQAEITQKLEKLQFARPDATPKPTASKSKPAERPPDVRRPEKDDEGSEDDEEQSASDGDDQTFGFGLVICPKTQKASWVHNMLMASVAAYKGMFCSTSL